MKRLLSIILVVMVGVALSAQSDEEEAWLFEEWGTNLEQGFAALQEEDRAEEAEAPTRFLFLYFAGTDWCPWCMKFEREILDTKAFRSFLDERLAPVLIDFPRTRVLSEEQQSYNQQLAQQYEVTGFPTVFLMREDGTIALRSGYQEGGAHRYINHLRRSMR